MFNLGNLTTNLYSKFEAFCKQQSRITSAFKNSRIVGWQNAHRHTFFARIPIFEMIFEKCISLIGVTFKDSKFDILR